MNDPTESHENALVGLTSLGILGAGLGALFLGVEDFWLVFVIGFAVLVPIVATLTGDHGTGEYDPWLGTREHQRHDETGEYDRYDDTGERHRHDGTGERHRHDGTGERHRHDGRAATAQQNDESGRSAERVEDAEVESKQDALDTLRERYARGDLSETDFERKVEALLETETPESARKRIERARTGDESERTSADRDADETEMNLETDERTR
ncbi:SHOCT domain-containing protein [Halorussus pelagicus]|uniref:SHOCT domain-containing protein n=1 Tax=Halorussus pelagicus TaxID=2505977 RepID=UPI000FFBD882|nr:SHOCT domain-containing protein [Halorussus pelagicus]